MTWLIYLLFLLSGAAALIYQIVWFRSLGLVFGGSHFAVTTVLAVFMGGLALGGWLLGRQMHRVRVPLRLYGWIEIGIGLSALAFALLLRFYPAIYVPLARLGETNTTWLSTIRIIFAVAGMMLPTTLMGGTLPVLSHLAARGPRSLGHHLPLLYGLNTLGAVIGTLCAAFVLLPRLGVARTGWIPVILNLAIGVVALWLAARDDVAFGQRSGTDATAPRAVDVQQIPGDVARLVLWGIGLSGFCALGYEVLWTRMLSMVVGTSVYSFAIMLVAFLAGIALGSQAQALVPRFFPRWHRHWRPAAIEFGLVQVTIGIMALATTYALRSLPAQAARLQELLLPGGGEFSARAGTTFLLAFAVMAMPAFFMGLAFPVAGSVIERHRGDAGRAIGEVLAFNTVGAILGATTSGFVLVTLLGIERSLQVLCVVNLGVGLTVLAAALGTRRAAGLTALAGAIALVVVGLAPDGARLWDRKLFAVYRNNQRTAFETDEQIRDALRNTDVLYYHEGTNETISVIRPKRAAQAFVVNGRVEASTHGEDIQCQRTLGHLPMLAHPDPRRVFVLGLGTGMTLGATSIHPEVEQIILAEIEPGVLPAARQFAEFNHDVLDNPKLRIVHNDGRNFLLTTRERFDVITADPIHPWSGGAAYLYTAEYFDLAARRLRPGGVLVQWLPIYELTLGDLRSVVRTLAENFRYTAIWLTYYDAEILASNEPLIFDEARLARRFADPAIAADLAAVEMGSPREFLSYMLMGDRAVRAFAAGGVLNTDDNLWLEFSAPRSQGAARLPGDNVADLTRYRESPLDYTEPLADPLAEAERVDFWRRAGHAAALTDRAHSLALWGRWSDPELRDLLTRLVSEAPDYAPRRFLERRYELARARLPRPLSTTDFPVADAGGLRGTLAITAVTLHTGEGRGAVVFVDNVEREIYGQGYLEAPPEQLDELLASVSAAVFEALHEAYGSAQAAAQKRGETLPARPHVARTIRLAVARQLQASGAIDGS